MKATYTSANGRLVMEMEAAAPKELFMKLAIVQEIFEADSKCGLCDSVNIRFKHRVTEEDYHYYELNCNDCGARLDYGQTRKGGLLFVKRKHDDPARGWYIYQGQQRDEWNQEPPQQQQPQQQQRSAPAPAQSQARPQAAQQRQPHPPLDDDVPF